MKMLLNTETYASHPRDKSLEAYIVWIMGERILHDHPETIFTEAEWVAAWKEYWEEGSNY